MPSSSRRGHRTPMKGPTQATSRTTELDGARLRNSMDLNRYLKELQRLGTALKKLHAPKKSLSDDVAADLLSEAIAAENALDLSELRPTLEEEAKGVGKRLEAA